MAYAKAHFDLTMDRGGSTFGPDLGLSNIGLSIRVFARGEGFDYFHNHREQEEVYVCLAGSADLKIGGDQPETIEMEAGDAVRVDPKTMRAIGNLRCDRSVVLITGGCPHPYPSAIADHDVIADVLSVAGKGTTGFTPIDPPAVPVDDTDEDPC